MCNQNLTDTQMRIGEAAFSLFASLGYKATTTKQIAKSASVNESTLFKNFKSKQDIFIVMKALKMNEIDNQCRTFFDGDTDSIETFLENTALFIYDLFLQHTDIVMIMLKELGHSELGMGENSLFEMMTKYVSVKLGKIKNGNSSDYISQSFLLVSSIVFLIVDQKHGNILTDEFEDKVSLLGIAKLVCKTI